MAFCDAELGLCHVSHRGLSQSHLSQLHRVSARHLKRTVTEGGTHADIDAASEHEQQGDVMLLDESGTERSHGKRFVVQNAVIHLSGT